MVTDDLEARTNSVLLHIHLIAAAQARRDGKDEDMRAELEKAREQLRELKRIADDIESGAQRDELLKTIRSHVEELRFEELEPEWSQLFCGR